MAEDEVKPLPHHFSRVFVTSKYQSDNSDRCAVCGRDLRDDVHLREGESVATRYTNLRKRIRELEAALMNAAKWLSALERRHRQDRLEDVDWAGLEAAASRAWAQLAAVVEAIRNGDDKEARDA